MFPDFNIYSTPLLILTLQGLLFFFLLVNRYLKKKSISDLLLAFILLITCYEQISYTLGFMGWYDTYRNTKINYYLINSGILLAPMLYLYFRAVTIKSSRIILKDWRHFLPFLLLLVIKVFILIYDSSQDDFENTQNGYLVRNFQWKYLDPILTLFSSFQMLVYLVFCYQILNNYRDKIQNLFSNTFKLELNWLKSFLIIYSILFLYQNFERTIDNEIIKLSWVQEWWYYFIAGLAIVYIGIKGYFTDLSELKDSQIRNYFKEDDSNGKITNKIQEFKNVISDYFENEKPYLKQELNLINLSQYLGMSREEVSETINKGFNMKFNDYVNLHRVNEFKKRISDKAHDKLSLLGLAFECGFNSKTTFNRVFKKITKVSPSDYVKSLDF